jgi:N-acetylmuramoyl-L-alanine amidase
MKELMMSALLAGALMLAPETTDSLAGHTIVIDPGHGGRDSGAIGNGIEEAPVVLALSRNIARALRSEGAKVVLTRGTDRYVVASRHAVGLGRRSLAARVELAREAHADLFLSIHANKYLGDSSIHGTQVFVGGSPDTNRMALATCLQERLNQVTLTHWPVNQTQSLYLMQHLTIPAALVEVGYLSNPHEARLLVNPVHQERLAAAVAQGLRCYYTRSSSPASMARQPAHVHQARHSLLRKSTATAGEVPSILAPLRSRRN